MIEFVNTQSDREDRRRNTGRRPGQRFGRDRYGVLAADLNPLSLYKTNHPAGLTSADPHADAVVNCVIVELFHMHETNQKLNWMMNSG